MAKRRGAWWLLSPFSYGNVWYGIELKPTLGYMIGMIRHSKKVQHHYSSNWCITICQKNPKTGKPCNPLALYLDIELGNNRFARSTMTCHTYYDFVISIEYPIRAVVVNTL